MNDLILVINCGSSSIKFALFDRATVQRSRLPLWSGKVEGIGSAQPTFSDSTGVSRTIALEHTRPYHAALKQIREHVQARLGNDRLMAVGHRIVHGGAKYSAPVQADAAVLADLRSFIPLAPLHQPFALEAVGVLLESRPELPQMACFDTAFHHTMPMVEQMLPLPWKAWERGVRRYGFHGLSYEYLSLALAERHGARARGRTIAAHLGSGASLCAMRNLQSIGTTMGFSALDGLMMGTRSGALDPGVVIYLMEIQKLSLERVGSILYNESGLLGVSGVSADPRVLLREEAGNARVQAALALYVHRIVREIGALVAVLGGLDMLVFTAGIGEHNAEIRSRICQGLEFLGITLSTPSNANGAPLISAPQSRVAVVIEPTNEEWVIARDTHGQLPGADPI